MRVAVGLVALLIATGCTLPRGVLTSVDGGGGGDFDTGPRADVGPVDAARIDGAIDDAGPGDDAGVDAGTDAGSDAGCTDDVVETCNGVDDDCNGVIDDGVTCRHCTAPGTCADCTRFEVDGRVYQTCPNVTGFVYWRRLCWTLGAGYDLAAFETETERDHVVAAFGAAGVGGQYHWIGLTDRETDGSYRWVDGSALAWTPSFTGGSHADEGFVLVQGDGQFDDWPLDSTHRALCELGAPTCVPRDRSDPSCDGADDDCDGFFDEDCEGDAHCGSRVFGDSVYYWCRDDMTQPEAAAECASHGAQLASLNDRFEREFTDNFATEGDAWVGLEQDAGASTTNGWHWLDGTAFPMSDPDWVVMWRAGDPNGNDDVQCAVLDTGLQDEECDTNRQETVCERPVMR